MSLDGFELSKIGGAIFAALLVMIAPGPIGSLLGGGENPSHGDVAKLGGYNLPIPVAKTEAAAPGGNAAPAAGFDAAAVVKAIAAGKPENGEAVYAKCAGCHTNKKEGKSGAGPSFWGLIGRKKGGLADYAGYSEAIKAKGGDWNYADLAAFLHDPKGWLPGTKMAANVADPTELADLLAYLRTLADTPAALP
jgi:cytochrome c